MTLAYMKNGKIDRTSIKVAEKSEFLTISYQIKDGWDVIVHLISADDHAQVYLNGVLIYALDINHSTPPISIKNILSPGANELRVVGIDDNPGGENYWSIDYTIGIFDANDKPAYDAIHIPLRGRSYSSGIKHDVIYTLIKV
ncbi:hypothetical protein [Azospirillum sp. B4]|uniref:hypothetical protein n=1 Tax=Azospirillum sp. B4 TaxID=95605 RepID=UPI0011DCFD31|nr:hypothetical protein [Azospirillum sp. B4]